MTDPLSPDNLARLEELAKAAPDEISYYPIDCYSGQELMPGASDFYNAFQEASLALIARVKEQEARIAKLTSFEQAYYSAIMECGEGMCKNGFALRAANATISRLRALLGRCQKGIWGEDILSDHGLYADIRVELESPPIDVELNPSPEGQPKCK